MLAYTSGRYGLSWQGCGGRGTRQLATLQLQPGVKGRSVPVTSSLSPFHSVQDSSPLNSAPPHSVEPLWKPPLSHIHRGVSMVTNKTSHDTAMTQISEPMV